MSSLTMETYLSNTTATAVHPSAYTELGQLGDLRREARQDPNGALREVARQFESLFIKMMLKSMRQASFGDPLFDSSQSRMYRDMFDNQISMDMARGQGIGLADSLVRQLQRYVPASGAQASEKNKEKQTVELPVRWNRQPGASEIPAQSANGAKGPAAPGQTVPAEPARDAGVMSEVSMDSGKAAGRQDLPVSFSKPAEFVRHLWPLAERAAQRLGVEPRVLLAQAALETGWGKAVNRRADGSSSFNLFNIKADARWQGETVQVGTLEYRDGVARREQARFRAYDSYADSFEDYVDFLNANPRYAQALRHCDDPEQFITRLHQAGYATDPGYADKVIDIMGRDDLKRFNISRAAAAAQRG